MLDQVNATPTPHKRLPWDKGKLTGAKPPLRPKHVWSIWTTLQIEGRARDLTMFNLAIDSKLRGSNLVHERPLRATSGHPRNVSLEEANNRQTGDRCEHYLFDDKPVGFRRGLENMRGDVAARQGVAELQAHECAGGVT
jgi:hypothetical protein